MTEIFVSILILLIWLVFAEFGVAVEKTTKGECLAACREAAQLVKDLGPDGVPAKVIDSKGSFVWKGT